jgi:hypothetical protein
MQPNLIKLAIGEGSAIDKCATLLGVKPSGMTLPKRTEKKEPSKGELWHPCVHDCRWGQHCPTDPTATAAI